MKTFLASLEDGWPYITGVCTDNTAGIGVATYLLVVDRDHGHRRTTDLALGLLQRLDEAVVVYDKVRRKEMDAYRSGPLLSGTVTLALNCT